MRIYEERVIEEHTVKEECGKICDLCKAESDCEGSWGENYYDRHEVTIELSEGRVYPEGGNTMEYDIDLCPSCFKKKLIKWVKEQGGRVSKKEKAW